MCVFLSVQTILIQKLSKTVPIIAKQKRNPGMRNKFRNNHLARISGSSYKPGSKDICSFFPLLVFLHYYRFNIFINFICLFIENGGHCHAIAAEFFFEINKQVFNCYIGVLWFRGRVQVSGSIGSRLKFSQGQGFLVIFTFLHAALLQAGKEPRKQSKCWLVGLNMI